MPSHGETIGPYRILSDLGSGGMGTVYLGEVVDPAGGLDVGARVALKVVHPHLLEKAGFFKRFLREAEIGRAVRHDNVVRCYDCDALRVEGEQTHFLVMEYVEGQTLRALLDELEAVPEELCRHVGHEIAAGLAAIHAVGVVHRDLKPENVLITDEHVVKIMDLGVAQLQDAAIRLSQTGHFVGSIHYAAPEQFGAHADRIDARADLHALGAILYELSSGRHPFHDDDPRAVLRRVLDETPRPVAELNPQLSPFFEELVHALLAKDPADRPATAALVGQILTEGEGGAWWQERARVLRQSTRRPLRRVRIPRDTALYGRAADLDRLDGLFERARSGAGQVLFLEGEAGVGKTRLVDEFVRRLEERGEDLHFLYGSYLPGGAATAAGAWSSAYREHFGVESLETTLRKYLRARPVLIPAFAAMLRGEPTPKGETPLTRDTLQTVFVQTTMALAEERPTIVLIEDLHFAPGEGHTMLASLAEAVFDQRVLLLATTRPGAAATWSVDLERHAHVQRHVVSRLGPRDLVELLQEAFHSEVLAQALSGRIAVKSDGNPFFVFEIIRALREEGSLAERPDGTWTTTERFRDITVPSSLTDLVSARVSTLERGERELLEVAACCGFEFDPLVAAAAAGLERVPGLKLLGQIEKRHRLVRSAGRRLVFDHHQVQEWLVDGIMVPLREEYHLAIARALEQGVGAEAGGALTVKLAGHFLAAGRDAEVLPHVLPALEHLADLCRNEQVVALAEQVLQRPALLVGPARVPVLLAQSYALDFLGRPEPVRRVLDEAVAIADVQGDALSRTKAHQALGWFHFGQSEYAEAEREIRHGLALAREAGDRDQESRAVSRLAGIFQRLGRLEDARREYERWRELSRELGDRVGEAGATGGIGNLHYLAGRYEEACAHYERYLALAREAGDRHHEGVATGNLGSALRFLGRYGEALAHTRQRLVIAGERGDRRGEALTQANLGGLLVSLGEFAESRRVLDASLRTLEEIGARREAGFALNGLAALAEAQGDDEEALACLERVLVRRRELEDPHGIGTTLLSMGRLHLAAGRQEEARACLEEALRLGEQQDDPSLFVGARCLLASLPGGDVAAAIEACERQRDRLAHTDRMDCLWRLWRLTDDRRYLAQAQRLLESLCARAPEALRDSMVERSPLLRSIRAAWAEQSA